MSENLDVKGIGESVSAQAEQAVVPPVYLKIQETLKDMPWDKALYTLQISIATLVASLGLTRAQRKHLVDQLCKKQRSLDKQIPVVQARPVQTKESI